MYVYKFSSVFSRNMFILGRYFYVLFVQLRIAKVKTTFCLCENSTSLAPDVANKIHDDRFYVAILLAHRLYELRRKDKVRQSAVETMTAPPICISNIDF